MEKTATPLAKKLLLNAEPFGFGPSAAMADLFAHLRPKFQWMGYGGVGHSLDLHVRRPYNAVYDFHSMENLDEALRGVELVFTAMDFKLAERCVDLGIPIAIFDPLLWFWKEVPAVARKAQLYLAPGFHGVEERLKSLPHGKMVKPLVEEVEPRADRSLVLLNLGGLQNPHWTPDICCDYASFIIDAVQKHLSREEELVVLTSGFISRVMADPTVKTLCRDEVRKLLPKVRYALQTPGLGNIYDAAAYNIPTIFLPPANDSQGQQLDLLREHDQLDLAIGWRDIYPDCHIDYRGSQREVLREIARLIERLTHDFPSLDNLIEDALWTIHETEDSKTQKLIKGFGCNGAEQVAGEIEALAQSLPTRESGLV